MNSDKNRLNQYLTLAEAVRKRTDAIVQGIIGYLYSNDILLLLRASIRFCMVKIPHLTLAKYRFS